MISPNDIKSKQFSRSISGYKIEEVEEFLDVVAKDYTKMLTDNAELIKKIEVVVSKLEEYRGNEESISNALLNAQKINEQVIREGKNKAELIIREANFKAERLIKNAQKEVDSEQQTLEALRKEVSGFKTRLFAIYRQHLDIIDTLPSYESEPAEDKEQPAETEVSEETVSVPETEEQAASVENTEAEAQAEPVADAEPDELDTDDDGQIVFDGAAERFKDIDIKFGAEYDYKSE